MARRYTFRIPNLLSDLAGWASLLNSFHIPTSVTKTAAYAATTEDHTIRVNAASAAVTITLPRASASEGHIWTIRKTDSSANVVTIDADGAETIDGHTTVELVTQFTTAVIQSNGTSHDLIGAVGTVTW